MQPWLPPMLALLSLWALLEAVLVWQRPPGPPPPPLPERMQLLGHWLSAAKKPLQLGSLPEGMTLQSAASYNAEGKGPRLLLAWIVLQSSGNTVSLDPPRLALALLGPDAKGACRIHSRRDGRLIGVGSTGAEVGELLRQNDPDSLEKLQWALGLRPWRLNRCLFVGVVGR